MIYDCRRTESSGRGQTVCQCMGHQCIIEFASSSSSSLCVLGSFFLVDVILIPEYTDVHVMRLQTRQHRNSSSRFSHILLSIMRKNSFLSIHISIVHIQAVCVYERVSFGINKKEDTNGCSHIQLQQCNVPAYFPSDVYLVSRIVSIVQSSQYH